MPALKFRRAGVAAVAMTGLAFLATTPAQAATSALPYDCAVAEFPGVNIPITSTFDSALDDGEIVAPGDVVLNPVAGQVVIAEAEVGLLRWLNITSLEGSGTLQAGIDETGQDLPVNFSVGRTPVPAAGAMSITFNGSTAGPATVEDEGQYGFVAGDADIALTTDSGSKLTLACTLNDGDDAPEFDDLIDFFEVQADEPSPTPTPTTTPSAPTATPSPTTAPSPVRPDVVQTDAAQPTSPSWVPFAGLAGSIALGGGLLVARRSAARH